jgi:hypothetical protein
MFFCLHTFLRKKLILLLALKYYFNLQIYEIFIKFIMFRSKKSLFGTIFIRLRYFFV